MASSSSKLSLTLLIDQTAKRVVFAEAGKETVDFLFSILALPLGTVIRLLSEQGMEGSLANIYQSVKNMNGEFMLPNLNKDVLLKPSPCTSTQEVPLLALTNNSNTTPPKKRKLLSKFYVCSNTSSCSMQRTLSPLSVLGMQQTTSGSGWYDGPTPGQNSHIAALHTRLAKGVHESPTTKHDQFPIYVTVNSGTRCPGSGCNIPMDKEVNLLGDVREETVVNKGGGGFVKGVVTYMVMDDLVVKPMSTVSSVALLKKLNVKDVDAIEEKVVQLNIDMGLRLLKTAFHSKEVLTNVFLRQGDPSVEVELNK